MTEESTTAHNADTEVVDNTTDDVEKESTAARIVRICVISNNVLNIPLTICAFLLFGQPNQGFNVLMFAIISCLKCMWNYMLVRSDQLYKYPITYGAWLGSSMIMIFVYLSQAIYWGQLSGCSDVKDFTGDVDVDHYECSHTSAMISVSVFTSFMFSFETVATFKLLRSNEEILNQPAEGQDDESANRSSRKKKSKWWEVGTNDISAPLLEED